MWDYRLLSPPCVMKSTQHTVSSNQKHIPVLSVWGMFCIPIKGTSRVCSSHHQGRGERRKVLPLKKSAVKTQNWMVEPNAGTREKVALWHSCAHSEEPSAGNGKGKLRLFYGTFAWQESRNRWLRPPLSFFYVTCCFLWCHRRAETFQYTSTSVREKPIQPGSLEQFL